MRIDARSLSRFRESSCNARFILANVNASEDCKQGNSGHNYMPMSRQVSLEIAKVIRERFQLHSFCYCFSLQCIYSFQWVSCTIAICLHTYSQSQISDMA